VTIALKDLGELKTLQSNGAAAAAKLADLALGDTAEQRSISLGQVAAHLLLTAKEGALAVGKVAGGNLVELGPDAVSAADAGIEQDSLSSVNHCY